MQGNASEVDWDQKQILWPETKEPGLIYGGDST